MLFRFLAVFFLFRHKETSASLLDRKLFKEGVNEERQGGKIGGRDGKKSGWCLLVSSILRILQLAIICRLNKSEVLKH